MTTCSCEPYAWAIRGCRAVGASLLQRSISIAKLIDQMRGTLGDQPKILQHIDIVYLSICLYKRRPKTELSQPQPQLRTHLTSLEVDCVRLSTTACALPFTPESLFQSDTSPKKFQWKAATPGQSTFLVELAALMPPASHGEPGYVTTWVIFLPFGQLGGRAFSFPQQRQQDCYSNGYTEIRIFPQNSP